MCREFAPRRSSTFLLALALAAPGVALAQGRKLSGPAAFHYAGDVREFVLGAGGCFVYRAIGVGGVPYSIQSTPRDGIGASATLYSNAFGIENLGATPDGARILFRAGQPNYSNSELFSVPSDGSQPPVRLHRPLVDGEDVFSYMVSADSGTVVFEATLAETNPQGNQVFPRRLYAAPPDGAHAPVLLTPNQVVELTFGSYAVTPDSTRLVFRAVVAGTGRYVLYSVPLDGSASPVQLSPSDGAGSFLVSADSSHAVFLAGRFVPALQSFVTEIFAAPLDGSAPAQRLNAPLPPYGEVLSLFGITPDSQHVTYAADQTTNDIFGFYTVPIGGGTPLQLASLPGRPYYVSHAISPDGTRVVYATPSYQLFSVPMDGSSAPVRLDPSLGNTQAFEITPDSQRVVFAAGETVYGVPLDGSSAAVPLVPAAPDQYVQDIEILPSSDRALFRVVQQLAPYYDNTYTRLFSAPTDGSTPAVRLDSSPSTPATSTARGVTSFVCDRSTGEVVYRADQIDAYFFELYSAPFDGSAPNVVRSDVRSTLEVTGGVYDFLVAPDGEDVLYRAYLDGGFGGSSSPGVRVYDVPLSGAPTSTPMLVPLHAFTPDSGHVYFPMGTGVYGGHRGLGSAPFAPDAPVAQLHPPTITGNVADERPSPDSTRMVFRYALDGSTVSLLYSTPIDERQLADLTRWASGWVVSFDITPDSQCVVFLGSPNRDSNRVFRVPLDGETPPVALHPPMTAGADVVAFALDPDGERVVFRADAEVDERVELYSVPVAGGPIARLNAPLVAGGDVTDFAISPDSTCVVFLADMDTDEEPELYVVPIGGGTPTKLVPAGLQGNASDFRIAPDSRHVVLRADLETSGALELYSVPLAGGALRKLSSALVPGGDVHSFEITADGGRVVYLADQDTDDEFELYGVRTDGSAAPFRLSVPLDAGRDVSTSTPFQLDPTGRWVLYDADADFDEVYELFLASLDFPLSSRRINGPLASTQPALVRGEFTSHGVVYLANEEAPDSNDLYLFELSRTPRARPR